MSTIVKNSITGFHMPALLYPTTAFAPYISQMTIEYHYGKHLQAYVNKLNELVTDSDFEGMTLREIVGSAPDGPLQQCRPSAKPLALFRAVHPHSACKQPPHRGFGKLHKIRFR